VDNFFVKAFYETGLLGLTFFAWTIVLWIGLYRRTRWRVSKELREVLSYPCTIMLFVLVISLFTGSFGTYPWNLLWWMSLSGSMALLGRERGTYGTLSLADNRMAES
jgi:hypothetical protein